MCRVIRSMSSIPACQYLPLLLIIINISSSLQIFLLPARASEQGNVIGLVSVYIYYIYICHQKKIVIEQTRDLIYLKFVASNFSPKITSPSAGENSGDSA